jgi:hypothetical protein
MKHEGEMCPYQGNLYRAGMINVTNQNHTASEAAFDITLFATASRQKG